MALHEMSIARRFCAGFVLPASIFVAACTAGLPRLGSASSRRLLAEECLRNLEYSSEWTRTRLAKLVHGVYREPTAPDAVTETVVRLAGPIAYGKIRGREVAAVVLVTELGGSGVFYSLAVVVEEGGRAKNVSTVRLGDRVPVRSAAVRDGRIIIHLRERGPTDPYCCPTKERRRRFLFVAGELREQ